MTTKLPKTTNVKLLDDERHKNSKVLAVMQHKGGSGKTTLAAALGFYCARSGKNVLFIDLDPQTNLGQRLMAGSDKRGKKFEGRNLKSFFIEPYPQEIETLLKVKYLSRLSGSDTEPGRIAIAEGHAIACNHADTLAIDLAQCAETRLATNSQTLEEYMSKYIEHMKNYYDIIIFDTAPSMLQNTLNKLAAALSDEIIYPVDGIEATYGIARAFDWIMRDVPRSCNTNPVNGTIALVKSHRDTSSVQTLIQDDDEEFLYNSVHKMLREAFGDFVCKNVVKELRSLRTRDSSDLALKNDYMILSKEIMEKINQPDRNSRNLFNFINQNGAMDVLTSNRNILARSIAHKYVHATVPIYASVPRYDEPADPSTKSAKPKKPEKPEKGKK